MPKSLEIQQKSGIFATMLKMLRVYISLVVLAAAFVGCGSSESLPEPEPTPVPQENAYLAVDVNRLQLDYPTGQQKLHVESNVKWRVSNKHSWLSLSRSSGEDSGEITVVWSANVTTADRSDTILVNSDQYHRLIPVTQKHKADTAHIVSFQGIMGNVLRNEEDTIEVCFDRPVTVSETIFNDGRLGITKQPTLTDGNRVFRVPFKGHAGMELKCHFIFTSNSDGTKTAQTFVIPFYQKRFPIEASGEAIRHSVLSDDGKSIWVAVSSVVTGQHRLMQVSLDDCSVMQRIDLPFAPGYVCLNPYNHLLYVTPYNYNRDVAHTESFCVADPQQGKIKKTITIEQSPTTHPQHPTNYPVELEFTKNGLGILLLISTGDSGREWRYVDSADDDKITLSGYKWHEYTFEHVYQNYDRTRIYATEYPTTYRPTSYISRENPKPTEIIIHGKFESDKYYAGGNLMDFRMSPYANKAFICTAPGSQCVVNLDPLGYSEVCEVEARGSKCAWDTNSPERDLVYQVCPTKLQNDINRCMLELFDMTSGELIFATPHEFIPETYNELVNCHFRKDTDQLIVVSYKGVYLLDASDMKRRRSI